MSTGPVLVIQFSSKIGSLSGSSINYGFDVRRVTQQDAERMVQTQAAVSLESLIPSHESNCSETTTNWRQTDNHTHYSSLEVDSVHSCRCGQCNVYIDHIWSASHSLLYCIVFSCYWCTLLALNIFLSNIEIEMKLLVSHCGHESNQDLLWNHWIMDLE